MARGSVGVGCARRRTAEGRGLGERMVAVGRGDIVGLLGAGGQEHGQDGANTPADSLGTSVGGAVRGRAVVGLGERARGDRERERRDAASRVGLGGVVPVRIAGGSVLLREVSVTTRDGRIFLSGGPGPVGPVRSHPYRTSCLGLSEKFAADSSATHRRLL
jgi:hypothetical protein